MSKLPPKKSIKIISPNFLVKSDAWPTYMFHVEDVLVPHGEENQDGQDGAADEGDGLGDDCGHGGHEDVHVVSRWSVCSGQPGSQLVFKLVKMSEKGNCDYQYCGTLHCDILVQTSDNIVRTDSTSGYPDFPALS